MFTVVPVPKVPSRLGDVQYLIHGAVVVVIGDVLGGVHCRVLVVDGVLGGVDVHGGPGAEGSLQTVGANSADAGLLNIRGCPGGCGQSGADGRLNLRLEEAEEELIRDREPELEAVEAFLPKALTETNP